jgi:hypothetical protein
LISGNKLVIARVNNNKYEEMEARVTDWENNNEIEMKSNIQCIGC